MHLLIPPPDHPVFCTGICHRVPSTDDEPSHDTEARLRAVQIEHVRGGQLFLAENPNAPDGPQLHRRKGRTGADAREQQAGHYTAIGEAR